MHLNPLSRKHPLRTRLIGFGQIYLQADARFGLILLLTIAWSAPQLLPGALLGTLLGPSRRRTSTPACTTTTRSSSACCCPSYSSGRWGW
ncbi:urea transporter [Pseudomonas nitroreducens]|uniref:urea transporter n=1 Tax=Pseudomonas nitroreducens TaxID=46680 RepID=UPI0028A6C0A3|nr:urea transporter [Pseudomonas nitroreducens]